MLAQLDAPQDIAIWKFSGEPPAVALSTQNFENLLAHLDQVGESNPKNIDIAKINAAINELTNWATHPAAGASDQAQILTTLLDLKQLRQQAIVEGAAIAGFFSKLFKKIKKAANSVIQAVKHVATQAAKGVSKAVTTVIKDVKEVALAPSRAAFLGLVALNMFGLASSFAKVSPDKVHAFWGNFAPDNPTGIDKYISEGAKKKVILGPISASVSTPGLSLWQEMLDDSIPASQKSSEAQSALNLIENISKQPEAAIGQAGAIAAAAAPILAAAIALLKQLGVISPKTAAALTAAVAAGDDAINGSNAFPINQITATVGPNGQLLGPNGQPLGTHGYLPGTAEFGASFPIIPVALVGAGLVALYMFTKKKKQ